MFVGRLTPEPGLEPRRDHGKEAEQSGSNGKERNAAPQNSRRTVKGAAEFAARQRVWLDAEIADALLGVALRRMARGIAETVGAGLLGFPERIADRDA